MHSPHLVNPGYYPETDLMYLALTLGTVFSIGVGVLYLWVFPVGQYSFWPHFMMLSFYLFVIISMGMVLISLFDKRSSKQVFDIKQVMEKTSKGVVVAWVLLAASYW